MPADLYTCQSCRQVCIPPELVEETPRGGIYTVPARCEPCRAADRAPQGEASRLFEPAPPVMPGQLEIGA
jgi:hypothetical protein